MPDPAPRWTPETEELVDAAIQAETGLPGWVQTRRRVLTALADAGLLLPPGGETREEWGEALPGCVPNPSPAGYLVEAFKRYVRAMDAEESAHADAEAEYATEQLALACQRIVWEIDQLSEPEQPVGWRSTPYQSR